MIEEAVKLEQIEESNRTDVGLNNEAHKESQSVHAEPSKVKETSAPVNIEGPEGAEGCKKWHRNVVFIGHMGCGLVHNWRSDIVPQWFSG